MLHFLYLSIIIFLIRDYAGNYIEKEMDLKPFFDAYGVEGCFVIYDPGEKEWISYNPERCGTGYIPKSTFKIPHALIALEEGVVKDEREVIQWDGTQYPFESWNQDQNLKTAMKFSCVWFFSEVSRRVDSMTYKDYLVKFKYGNGEVYGPPTHFWLFGKLKVSANEQIEFLDRFYHHKLGISSRSGDLVKQLILLEQTDDYQFYGKTGGGPVNNGSTLMWFIGFLEKGEDKYFFSMNFTCSEYNQETAQARMEITLAVLKELDIL